MRVAAFLVVLFATPIGVLAQCASGACGASAAIWGGATRPVYFVEQTLTIDVDDAACAVAIAGAGGAWEAVQTQGTRRVLRIPSYSGGVYNVRCRWPDGSEKIEVVRFAAGESPRVAFWLATAKASPSSERPIFGLTADRLGKVGDPPVMQVHKSDGAIIEGPNAGPKDDGRLPIVTLWGRNSAQLASARAMLEPYADRVRLNSFDVTNKNVAWVARPFKLDEDKSFQQTGFKATFQQADGREVEAVYDPNQILQGLRKIDPAYDPNRPLVPGLPDWLAKILPSSQSDAILLGAIALVLFYAMLTPSRKP